MTTMMKRLLLKASITLLLSSALPVQSSSSSSSTITKHLSENQEGWILRQKQKFTQTQKIPHQQPILRNNPESSSSATILSSPRRRRTQSINTGTALCSDGITTGYTNWSAAALDLQNDQFLGTGAGGTFTLCPNTRFDASYVETSEDSLAIYQSNVLFQCGSDGSSNNNCTVTGGELGIAVVGYLSVVGAVPPINVVIRGISFVGDDDSSEYSNVPTAAVVVNVLGSQILVEDCIFANATDTLVGTESYSVVSASGSLVTVSDCLFEDNHYAVAGYVIGEGSFMVVKDCIFRNNQIQAPVGILATLDSLSFIFIASSCFIDNEFLDIDTPGIIYSPSSSNVVANDENHAEGNVVAEVGAPVTCDGIFILDLFSCEEFTEEMCSLLPEQYAPSAAPSNAPSPAPSSGPITAPSAAPVIATSTSSSPTAVNSTEDNVTSAPVAASAAMGFSSRASDVRKNAMIGIFAIWFLL